MAVMAAALTLLAHPRAPAVREARGGGSEIGTRVFPRVFLNEYPNE